MTELGLFLTVVTTCGDDIFEMPKVWSNDNLRSNGHFALIAVFRFGVF